MLGERNIMYANIDKNTPSLNPFVGTKLAIFLKVDVKIVNSFGPSFTCERFLQGSIWTLYQGLDQNLQHRKVEESVT